jgi:hypothetical protein
MALLTTLPNELLVSIISRFQSHPPLLCSLYLQCRRLNSLIRPFLYKYIYIRPSKNILLLRSINVNPQLLSLIKFVGVTGNWNDQEGRELMGRLEEEGVVFWSLPNVGYCGNLRPRRVEGVLTDKVEHCRQVVEREFEGVAEGEVEE